MRIHPSLLDATLDELLRLASRALYLPNPGSGLDAVDTPAGHIARVAADGLVTSVAALVDARMDFGVFEALNRISTLGYEKRAGLGGMVLAREDHPDVVVSLRLSDPIPLSERRAVRKLLEVTRTRDLWLLANGRQVFGLGHLADTYDRAAEDAFQIVVAGEGTWELRHGDLSLLRVEYGVPMLPRQKLTKGRFADVIERVFDGSESRNPDLLWSYAEAAANAEHGAMLVVSADGEGEAERLGNQALPMDPAPLAPATVTQLSSIDGALLLTPDGVCHAAGVILDGVATDEGDRSRGARFNSAVRYRRLDRAPTVIVIVSEDGMIDLLPDLRPRVRRSLVQQSLSEVRDTVEATELDFGKFFDAYERLTDFAFYLSPDECDEANTLRAQVEDIRWASNNMRVGFDELVPNPDMDASYFLEE